MVAISHLAVMDFNSGINRKQAATKTSDLRYKLSYLKVTQNWVVKKNPEQKQRNYLPSIMQEIALQRNFVKNCSQTTEPADISVNIAPIEKPDKKEAIKQTKTRSSL